LKTWDGYRPLWGMTKLLDPDAEDEMATNDDTDAPAETNDNSGGDGDNSGESGGDESDGADA